MAISPPSLSTAPAPRRAGGGPRRRLRRFRHEERDAVAGQRPAHGAELDLLAGRIADLTGGLGLAVAVADLQPPGGAHARDDLWVERLAAAGQLAQADGKGGQILEHQQTP